MRWFTLQHRAEEEIKLPLQTIIQSHGINHEKQAHKVSVKKTP